MKYCPYCGAALPGGAVSFCAACGKPMPDAPRTQSAEHDGVMGLEPDSQLHAANKLSKAKKNKPHGKERPPRKEKRQRRRPPVKDPEPDPQDEGYDGYYDDVRPLDNGHERERMDPELIKRIALVGGGAVLVIGLAVLMMFLI